MKNLTILLAALPLLATNGCSALRAGNALQTAALEQGTWTGVMSFVDSGIQHRLGAAYDVTVKGDTIAIMMHVGGEGSLPLNDIKLIDGKLMFSVSPGALAHCTLTRRDDRAFEGPCIAPGRPPEDSTLRILMVPPAKE
jgi:hypothetical protein